MQSITFETNKYTKLTKNNNINNNKYIYNTAPYGADNSKKQRELNPVNSHKTTGVDKHTVNSRINGSRNCYLENKYNNHKCSVNCELQFQVRFAVGEAEGLFEPRFRLWHYKLCYQIGVSRYLQLLGMAKEGRSPKRLFIWLLNKEVQNVAV